MICVMWSAERLWSVGVSQRVHVSDLVDKLKVSESVMTVRAVGEL
jgi:hypothetical protein